MAFRAHPHSLMDWLGQHVIKWSMGSLLEVTGTYSRRSLENSPVIQQVDVLNPFMARSKYSECVTGFEGRPQQVVTSSASKSCVLGWQLPSI